MKEKYKIEIRVCECVGPEARAGNIFNSLEEAQSVAELLRKSRKVMCDEVNSKDKKREAQPCR